MRASEDGDGLLHRPNVAQDEPISAGYVTPLGTCGALASARGTHAIRQVNDCQHSGSRLRGRMKALAELPPHMERSFTAGSVDLFVSAKRLRRYPVIFLNARTGWSLGALKATAADLGFQSEGTSGPPRNRRVYTAASRVMNPTRSDSEPPRHTQPAPSRARCLARTRHDRAVRGQDRLPRRRYRGGSSSTQSSSPPAPDSRPGSPCCWPRSAAASRRRCG